MRDAEIRGFATASDETGKTLRSVATPSEAHCRGKGVADVFPDMLLGSREFDGRAHEVTDALGSMRAVCEPAAGARQVIDLTLARAAGVFSKRRLVGARLFLRSPSGSVAGVIDYAR